MTLKINIKLLKSIIETDFLLVSGRLKQKNCYLKSGVLLGDRKKNKVTYSLEVFELIKSIKQLVRLIKFLKSSTKSNLYICSSNNQFMSLITNFLKENPSLVSIKLLSNLAKIKGSLDMTQTLLALDNSLFESNKMIKRLFEENISLIYKINSKKELSHGVYKMFNDVSNFKKLIFLITVINHGYSIK